MSDSPRHNVGSVKDPHWVVDEEHYLKAVADSDHFFVLSGKYLERANDAEAQRDTLLVAFDKYGQHFRKCINTKDNSCDCGFISVYYAIRRMKECGK